MEIEFDPEKSARNAEARGLPFDLARDAFQWEEALILEDERRDYGERRFLAFAPMFGRLHVVCYCVRGEARWIISFRRASKREEKLYGEAKTADR